jgi:ABC-type maltose transport system permease subunit
MNQSEYTARLNKIRTEMKREKIDVLMLLDRENTTYLTNLWGFSPIRLIILVVPLETDPYLIVPMLEAEYARAGTWVKDVVGFTDWHQEGPIAPGVNELQGFLKNKGLLNKVVGIEKNYLSINLFNILKAAYSFTRFTYRWNVDRLSLLVYIVPPVLLMIPIFLIFQRLHLNNSYLGLALSHSTFMLPFATLLLVVYFRSIPVELDEAVLIDGANRIKVITNIILPVALPGMVATGIIVFAFSWNDYLYAFTLISVPEIRTIPLGIAQFSQSQYMEWGMLMAAVVLTTLSMLLFFLFIQRKLLAGFIFAPIVEKVRLLCILPVENVDFKRSRSKPIGFGNVDSPLHHGALNCSLSKDYFRSS